MNIRAALQVSLLLAASQAAVAEQFHQAEIDKVAYSLSGTVQTAIDFVNRSGSTRKVYWLNYEGERELYQVLEAGQTHSIETFLTHPWLIADKDDNALAIYYPDTKKRAVELK